MLTLSLILNIVVLVPVCLGLLLQMKWTVPAFGSPTPSGGILVAIYLTILSASIALMIWHNVQFAVALLTIQIVYKLLTPLTVGSLENRVVLSNLAIAAFHIATVWTILH